MHKKIAVQSPNVGRGPHSTSDTRLGKEKISNPTFPKIFPIDKGGRTNPCHYSRTGDRVRRSREYPPTYLVDLNRLSPDHPFLRSSTSSRRGGYPYGRRTTDVLLRPTEKRRSHPEDLRRKVKLRTEAREVTVGLVESKPQ